MALHYLESIEVGARLARMHGSLRCFLYGSLSWFLYGFLWCFFLYGSHKYGPDFYGCLQCFYKKGSIQGSHRRLFRVAVYSAPAWKDGGTEYVPAIRVIGRLVVL